MFIINSSRADNTTAFCSSSTPVELIILWHLVTTLHLLAINELTISYPFWRLDNYNFACPQYCGYPGFGINCSQIDSILYISSDSYNVTNIDYSVYSINLVDIDALDDKTCPRVHHNVTLHKDFPLKYSELDLFVNFYYNCIHSPNSYIAYPFDCLNSNGNKSYHAEEEEDFDWTRICEKKVVVPVTKDGFTRGIGAAMVEGFLLHWVNAATECVECEASQGRCGYNNSAHESLCYCKDGTVKFDNCNTKGTPFFFKLILFIYLNC